MQSTKAKPNRLAEIIIAAILLLAVSAGSYAYFSYRQSRFAPPDVTAGKEIEDYFIEKMGMTAEEARKNAENGVSFYVTENTTLDGIIGNLYYYGFVKDEAALREALAKTKDITPGKEGAIAIPTSDPDKEGINTIDINAYYGLKKGMTAWEIADILLNQPTYLQGRTYNYLFMPGIPKREQPTERGGE